MPGTFAYDESTNTVTVTGGTSGSPADFASFVVADRENTAILANAVAPASNLTLTYQIRPVEFRALVISFYIYDKTAQTDYLFITGTDAWDNAQTESIDVSAISDDTVTTTKRFRTITNIDCSDNPAGGGTVWADGEMHIFQDIWGVIWDLCTNTYALDCLINFGDGSTATYFGDSAKIIRINDGVAKGNWDHIWTPKVNTTLRLGTLISDTLKTTKDGCHIVYNDSTYSSNYIIWPNSSTTTLLQLYSCTFQANVVNQCFIGGACAENSRIWNCSVDGPTLFNFGSKMDINRLTLVPYAGKIGLGNFRGTLNDAQITTNGGKAFYGDLMNSLIARDIKVLGASYTFSSYDMDGDSYLIDTYHAVWSTNLDSLSSGNLYRQYSCNIKICDKAGSPIEDAIVDCVDINTDAVWGVGTVLTDANGNITEQTISYKRYYYSGGQAEETYSPHKFTISKAGYKTLVLDNITVDDKIDWRLELQPIDFPPAYWEG